jgi:integrase
MPVLHLTEITVRNLERTSTQTTYYDEYLPSFGIRIGARRRTWIVMLGKERQRISLGHYPALSLAEARKKAHHAIGTYQPSSSSLFADARDAFIEQHCKRRNKASTALATEQILRRLPFSGPLHSITRHDINRVLDGMTPGGANNSFTAARTFFNWCVANHYLKVSPLQNAKKPYPARARDRVLTDDELRASWKLNGDFADLWKLLVLSGQRLSQIAKLRTDWIVGNTIVFPGSVMKHNTQHVIPLTPAMKAILNKRTPRNGFFFPAPCGTKPFGSFSTGMRDFRRSLSIPGHFTLHDARRTFSTKMSEWEICPIDITEAILAHTAGSRNAVQRTYDRHTRLPQMEKALIQLHTRLFRLLDTHTE